LERDHIQKELKKLKRQYDSQLRLSKDLEASLREQVAEYKSKCNYAELQGESLKADLFASSTILYNDFLQYKGQELTFAKDTISALSAELEAVKFKSSSNQTQLKLYMKQIDELKANSFFKEQELRGEIQRLRDASEREAHNKEQKIQTGIYNSELLLEIQHFCCRL
jgi:hypothetical protein